jgi:hypothetical protein
VVSCDNDLFAAEFGKAFFNKTISVFRTLVGDDVGKPGVSAATLSEQDDSKLLNNGSDFLIAAANIWIAGSMLNGAIFDTWVIA